ncbi:MAG: DivIVA domain-containing protein [Proteobacteria bacterium]|nr:DivIVA domain-containing protein [Pseudomonadota bacterium]
MKMTPLDILQHKFKISFRGFDVREVDGFLEDIADAFQLLMNENETLKNEIDKLKQDIQKHLSREETFKLALLNSQSVLEQMKDNAQKSAEVIIADAEVKAEKILSRTSNRLVQLQEDISELKRQRIQLEVRIASVIEAHSKLLDMGRGEQKAMDEEDAKVKLFAQSV